MQFSKGAVLGKAEKAFRGSRRLNQKDRRLLIAKQSAARARAEVVGSGSFCLPMGDVYQKTIAQDGS